MKEKEKKGTHSDHDEVVAATPSSLWWWFDCCRNQREGGDGDSADALKGVAKKLIAFSPSNF